MKKKEYIRSGYRFFEDNRTFLIPRNKYISTVCLPCLEAGEDSRECGEIRSRIAEGTEFCNATDGQHLVVVLKKNRMKRKRKMMNWHLPLLFIQQKAGRHIPSFLVNMFSVLFRSLPYFARNSHFLLPPPQATPTFNGLNA